MLAIEAGNGFAGAMLNAIPGFRAYEKILCSTSSVR